MEPLDPKPPQTAATTPEWPELVRSLAQRPPSPQAISAAAEALAPAGRSRAHRVAALVQTVFASFPPHDADEQAMDLLMAWLLDAMLERPLWAIQAGCRSIALTARFRPTPAEILAAIDEAAAPLRIAFAEARVAERLGGADRARSRNEPTPEERARRAAILETLRRKIGDA